MCTADQLVPLFVDGRWTLRFARIAVWLSVRKFTPAEYLQLQDIKYPTSQILAFLGIIA